MKYNAFKKIGVAQLRLGDTIGDELNGRVHVINFRETDSLTGKVLNEGKIRSFIPLEEIDVDESTADKDGYAVATNVKLSSGKGAYLVKPGATLDTEGFGRY
jgi:hypothetical protein